MAWAIWTNKSQTHLYLPCYNLQQMIQECEQRLAECLNINQHPQLNRPQPQALWLPPPTTLVKINFDGRIFFRGELFKSYCGCLRQWWIGYHFFVTTNFTSLYIGWDWSYAVLLWFSTRASIFYQLRYSHVKREGNRVANSLARYAAHILYLVVWMEDVPPQCFPVIQVDLAGFS